MSTTTDKCNVFYLNDQKADKIGLNSDDYSDADFGVEEKLFLSQFNINNKVINKIWANNLSNNISLFPGIRRGDVVSVFSDTNRNGNDGLFVYDGTNIVSLDTGNDEYGNIPSVFRIEEFHPRYWSDIIV